MSFWNLSNGENLTKAQTDGTMDMGGDIPPIPDKTDCLGAIEEAKWDEYNGDRYVSLKWRVMGPFEYVNRVVFQKLKIFGFASDKDPVTVADKAKRMLAAIDTNAGGQLMRLDREPTDEDLMEALIAKTMVIKVMVWMKTKEKDGTDIPKNLQKPGGNHVGAVSPCKSTTPLQHMTKAAAAVTAQKLDDDIPF